MTDLEELGMVEKYTADIDPRQAGLPFCYHSTCATPISERADVAEEVVSFPEVVEVTELVTGQENLHVRLVGKTDRAITRMDQPLDELGFEINDENLLRAEHTTPLDLTALEESR